MIVVMDTSSASPPDRPSATADDREHLDAGPAAPGPVVVVGAGGHGREALAVLTALARHDPRWSCPGFVDEGTPPLAPLERLGTRLLGGPGILDAATRHVIAVGDPAARADLDARLLAAGVDPDAAAVLVDPRAVVGPDVVLGPGAIVQATAVMTTGVRAGRHVHVNAASVVSHDCVLGDHVSVSPGVLLDGAVHVGDRVLLGTGAVVLPGRRIGDGAVVGAGAVVVDDVAPGATVVGVPARPLSR